MPAQAMLWSVGGWQGASRARSSTRHKREQRNLAYLVLKLLQMRVMRPLHLLHLLAERPAPHFCVHGRVGRVGITLLLELRHSVIMVLRRRLHLLHHVLGNHLHCTLLVLLHLGKFSLRIQYRRILRLRWCNDDGC